VTATFVVVPQWQGSPSSRAMRLADGAAAIRTDLPSTATRDVAVPLESGDAQGTGVARFSSLQLVREHLRDALDGIADTPIVIGGDCGVSSAAVTHAAEKRGDLALIWFDAHPDLNSPENSPSGAYGGMVLRSLLDDGVVPRGRVLLAGERSWDPGEDEFVAAAGIRALTVDELTDPTALLEAVAETGAEAVYLHIDSRRPTWSPRSGPCVGVLSWLGRPSRATPPPRRTRSWMTRRRSCASSVPSPLRSGSF